MASVGQAATAVQASVLGMGELAVWGIRPEVLAAVEQIMEEGLRDIT